MGALPCAKAEDADVPFGMPSTSAAQSAAITAMETLETERTLNRASITVRNPRVLKAPDLRRGTDWYRLVLDLVNTGRRATANGKYSLFSFPFRNPLSRESQAEMIRNTLGKTPGLGQSGVV